MDALHKRSVGGLQEHVEKYICGDMLRLTSDDDDDDDDVDNDDFDDDDADGDNSLS